MRARLYPIGGRSESGDQPRDNPLPSQRMLLARSLLAALAGVLIFASGATAATLATEKPCYQEGADVVATGTGFGVRALVGIALDGSELGLAQANEQGIFRNKIVAPSVPAGAREREYDLIASDGINTAIKHFRATEVFAGFSPSKGRIGTLRVRFRVFGFGLYKSDAKVYVHYVRPSGKVRRTVYLGKARGKCGHIRRTRRQLLFPFTPERGTWMLQFDTRKSYGKATDESTFAWFRRPVQVGS